MLSFSAKLSLILGNETFKNIEKYHKIKKSQ